MHIGAVFIYSRQLHFKGRLFFLDRQLAVIRKIHFSKMST